MRAIATDGAVARGLSVGDDRGPAKTAEPIEMPFEIRTRMGQWNHGGPDSDT